MDESLLNGIILGLSALIIGLSLYGVLAPGGLVVRVGELWQRPWSLPVAAGIRVVMGVAMIMVADTSRFPEAFLILGGIAIAAAVALPLMGKQVVEKILAWFTAKPTLFVRLWCLLGVAFGIFLGYGVI
jgi:hypothetical protein